MLFTPLSFVLLVSPLFISITSSSLPHPVPPSAQPPPGLSALQQARSAIPSANPSSNSLSCTRGPCPSLSASLLITLESTPCRTVFASGKCPTACATAISDALSHEFWSACKDACPLLVAWEGGETWKQLCEDRAETLIDQGKEAVKNLVGGGVSGGVTAGSVGGGVGIVVLLGGLLIWGVTSGKKSRRRRTTFGKRGGSLPM